MEKPQTVLRSKTMNRHTAFKITIRGDCFLSRLVLAWRGGTSFLTSFIASFGSTATSLFKIWTPAWSSTSISRFHRGNFHISYSARPRRIILLLICLTADSKIWENEITTVMFVKTSRVCVPCALNRLVANKNLFTQPKRRRHWTPSGNVPLRSRPFISRAHPKPQSTYFLAF